MTSEKLKRLFARCVDDAQFKLWNKGKPQGVRFVYACEFGVVWKFTPKAWWQFVTKAIRNHGAHEFLLSSAMRSRPKHIIKGLDNIFYSSDDTMRCVNPLNWNIENWTDELTRTGGIPPIAGSGTL